MSDERRKTRLLYWIPTGLLAALFVMSGTFNVTRQPNVMESLADLGYPAYLATLLGACKLLAAVTLVFGSRWPRLKEWAFAGLVFDLGGAVIAHLAAGEPSVRALPAGVLLVLTAMTYAAQRRFLAAVAPAPAPSSAAHDHPNRSRASGVA